MPLVCALGTSLRAVVQLSCRSVLSESGSNHTPWPAQLGVSPREKQKSMNGEAPGTHSLSKHFLGAPYVGGTVVGIRQGTVQFNRGIHNSAPTLGAAGTGQGPQGKCCVLKKGWLDVY